MFTQARELCDEFKLVPRGILSDDDCWNVVRDCLLVLKEKFQAQNKDIEELHQKYAQIQIPTSPSDSNPI